ncbi:DUF2214 domain-containing protein [Phyllobacterium salinisoli]|uniref:DUF2214 domain-containing protein n=1 Tax=Phyllobacterium salinisoli TaxID=1899321 RepID=A0A368K135_9HYPH|nr:DUF2214 domain-containing protein [Phyllobacterium salinisoli]RCS23097.1 DUF2214 domain-containing protein [Phyllobacterium salinisoli]
MELLQALSEWPVAVALRRSTIAYILVNAAHIFFIGLLVGSIVTLDLRIFGLFKRFPLAVLGPPLQHMAAAGIVLATLTGFLLFSVRPATYIQNTAFLTKIGVVGLGIANALLINRSPQWRHALASGEITVPLRIAALLSVGFWAGAVIAGRWIGFL